MKNFSNFGIFILLFLFSTTSLFASGVALTGIGARATAMAGAYRAISNDWSAMFWNPAGITQIQGMHAGMSFELIMPQASYTFSNTVPILKYATNGDFKDVETPFTVYRTGEVENEPQTFYIPALGFVYGLGKMSFGLSVYAPFGLGAKWDMLDTKAYNDQYPAIDFEDDLKIIDIHPTFAYKVSDKFSIGLGFSFVLSDILIRTPVTRPNPLLFDPDPSTGLLRRLLLSPMGLTDSTYNHILIEKKLEGDGIGFGFNFGVKYNLTEDLALGLSGNWYNDISLDGKISADVYGAKIDPVVSEQLESKLNSMVGAGFITESQKQEIAVVYGGQPVSIYNRDKGEAILPLPMTLGGGLAYSGIDKLLLGFDVSWTQWSAWDSIRIDIEKDTSTSYLVEKWSDGFRFSAGFEYQLSDDLKIRGGYYTEPSAVPNETLTITIPDISRRHAMSLGLSYRLAGFDLFASYEKIFIGDREVKNWIASKSLEDYENMAGKYKMNVNNIMFGVGYHF